MNKVDVKDVCALIGNVGPIRLFLGKVGVFEGKDHGKDYDVLYVEVSSPDLVKMHEVLKKLPHVESQRVFRPHVTIAYVKAGKGAEYAAAFAPLNLGVTADVITFSDTAGMKSGIDLAPGQPPLPETGARYHPTPIKEPMRYSTDDLRALLAQARQDPHNEGLHGIVADALDEAHPGHPVAELIRKQFGHGPYSGQERPNNLWHVPVENSWDGTFPYTADLGRHGPFNIRLAHEGAERPDGSRDDSNARWTVHAVSNQPGSQDFGYNFEFPYHQAYLIPAMFREAGKYIASDPDMKLASSNDPSRRDEALSFGDRMDDQERRLEEQRILLQRRQARRGR